MPVFEFSEKQSIVWDALNDPESPVEEVFAGGAAGMGKSVLISAFQILRRIMHPETVGFIGRKTSRTLEDTTMQTFIRWWNEFGKHNPDGITMQIKGAPKTAEFSNGSRILFRHIDPSDIDAHDFGSLELTDLCIDEVAECEERPVQILASRVRHKLIAGKRAILYAGNPSDNWVMERYVQKKDGNPVVLEPHQLFIPATLDDNPDKEFASQYRKSLEYLDAYDRDRLLHGLWGGSRENKQPYFWNFSYVKIGNYPVSMTEDKWFSFDFNYDPTTVVTGQKIYGKGIYINTEKQLKGGTAALCDRMIDDMDMVHDGYIWVTGDSSGSKASTAAGQEPGGRHVSDYLIIEQKLGISRAQMIGVGGTNANLVYSAKLVNYVFYKVPVFIDQSCREVLRDLQTAERDIAGGLVKDRKAHKQDAGDAVRYMIHAMFPGGMQEVDQFASLC